MSPIGAYPASPIAERSAEARRIAAARPRALECPCCCGARVQDTADKRSTEPCGGCGGAGRVSCECSADAVAYHWIVDGEDPDYARRLPTCHTCHDEYAAQGRVLHVAERP